MMNKRKMKMIRMATEQQSRHLPPPKKEKEKKTKESTQVREMFGKDIV